MEDVILKLSYVISTSRACLIVDVDVVSTSIVTVFGFTCVTAGWALYTHVGAGVCSVVLGRAASACLS